MNDRVDNPVEAGVERYVGLEHLDSDSLAIRRWGAPSDVTATKLLFRKGDIILGRRRVYQRKLAVADFKGICSAHALVLRARPRVVAPEFLPFFMQSDTFMKRAKAISVGSLSPTINWRTLANEAFVLPPLDEQRRLAKVLTAIEEALRAFAHLAHTIVKSEASVLQGALATKAKGEPPPVRVADLLREPPKNGLFVAPKGGQSVRQAGLKTVTVSAVAGGRFNPENVTKCVNVDEALAAQFLVQRDDAFVIRGNGNRSICGQAGLAEMSYGDVFYHDKLIRLRFDPARILPAFAVAQWNLPTVHQQFSARAKSTNGIWMVNGQDVRAHRLVVPPLCDQRRSLSVITSMRDLRDRDLKHRADRLARLKSILLNS